MKRTALLLAFSLSISAPVFADTLVKMETSMGDIELVLDEKAAPKSVANFVKYANKGHYNGTIFHRVIPNFMIQGGSFTPDMTQKATDAPIPNEAANGLKNQVGTIAMARTSDPNSATSQFFINVADNEFLNFKAPTPQYYGYAVFGRVSKGMEVVNKIVAVPTGNHGMHQNVPQKPVVIKSVKVISQAEKK
ncbi:MAG: peptidyl-prolyl cis-trans isomerase [Neisseriaceae bacterium]|nr:peptidyl-prolyl cis-trans isomerase [Neisseriaceae bacterium]